tara:strand:- start:225 stop:452 length:228 start_codon:yes stop_codon:yes gene_type:complete
MSKPTPRNENECSKIKEFLTVVGNDEACDIMDLAGASKFSIPKLLEKAEKELPLKDTSKLIEVFEGNPICKKTTW